MAYACCAHRPAGHFIAILINVPQEKLKSIPIRALSHFLQLGQITVLFRIDWPAPVEKMFGWASAVTWNLSILNPACALPTWSYFWSAATVLLGPFIAILLLLAIYKAIHRSALGQLTKDKYETTLLGLVVFIAVMSYYSEISYLLGIFVCVDYPDGSSRLLADPRLSCSDPIGDLPAVCLWLLSLLWPLECRSKRNGS